MIMRLKVDDTGGFEEVAGLFNGRDPFSEAMHRIRNMSQTELTALIFIAANRLGSALKGGEYKGARDSLVHIAAALDIIFDAYDNASPRSGGNPVLRSVSPPRR